jgi:hypothetical protein
VRSHELITGDSKKECQQVPIEVRITPFAKWLGQIRATGNLPPQSVESLKSFLEARQGAKYTPASTITCEPGAMSFREGLANPASVCLNADAILKTRREEAHDRSSKQLRHGIALRKRPDNETADKAGKVRAHEEITEFRQSARNAAENLVAADA